MQDASVATPTRYGILIAIMREYHWSWTDILNAPADLIDEISTRLGAETHWRNKKLEFDAELREQQRRR
jgi:hypothetical protein